MIGDTIRQVYPIPDTIAADGSRDVTAELLDWVSTVPDCDIDGVTVNQLAFGFHATYRVDGTFHPFNRHGLWFKVRGSTFPTQVQGTRNRSHWFLDRCSRIRVTDAYVVGANPKPGTYVDELEAQHGFDIESCQHVVLQNCRVTGNYGDGIYLGNHGQSTLSQDITVEQAWIDAPGRQGMTFAGVDGAVVHNSALGRVPRTMFDFESDGLHAGAFHITIDGNRCGAHHLNWVSAGGASPVTDIALTNNQLPGGPMSINVRSAALRARWLVDNNQSQGSAGSNPPTGSGLLFGMCMQFYDVQGVAVTRNVQPFQPRRNMKIAGFWDCTDIVCDADYYETATAS